RNPSPEPRIAGVWQHMKHWGLAFIRVSTEEQAAEGRGGIPRQRHDIASAAKRWDVEISETDIIENVGSSMKGAVKKTLSPPTDRPDKEDIVAASPLLR